MTAPQGEQTSYRGVNWTRAPDGSLSFYDEDGQRWVRWHTGADAPPLPPGWEPPTVKRAPWTTGWRLVPVAIAVFIIIVALVQTSHSPSKKPTAPPSLLGKCLAQSGSLGGLPEYSASPVSCSSSKAAVHVVAVHAANGPRAPSCPAGTTGIQIEAQILCLERVKHGS